MSFMAIIIAQKSCYMGSNNSSYGKDAEEMNKLLTATNKQLLEKYYILKKFRNTAWPRILNGICYIAHTKNDWYEKENKLLEESIEWFEKHIGKLERHYKLDVEAI